MSQQQLLTGPTTAGHLLLIGDMFLIICLMLKLFMHIILLCWWSRCKDEKQNSLRLCFIIFNPPFKQKHWTSWLGGFICCSVFMNWSRWVDLCPTSYITDRALSHFRGITEYVLFEDVVSSFGKHCWIFSDILQTEQLLIYPENHKWDTARHLKNGDCWDKHLKLFPLIES